MCLENNSIAMAKSCLVIATWLIDMLYCLPDTGVRDVARKALLDQFLNVLQSSKNIEEKILATLALKNFIADPGKVVWKISSAEKTDYHSWRANQ